MNGKKMDQRSSHIISILKTTDLLCLLLYMILGKIQKVLTLSLYFTNIRYLLLYQSLWTLIFSSMIAWLGDLKHFYVEGNSTNEWLQTYSPFVRLKICTMVDLYELQLLYFGPYSIFKHNLVSYLTLADKLSCLVITIIYSFS